jgi:hypothetical protein
MITISEQDLLEYASWLDEAAADIEDWGMSASSYLQEKWDLRGQCNEYRNRAVMVRQKVYENEG